LQSICPYLCTMTMNRDDQFSDIRPYRDYEYKKVIKRLFDHPAVIQLTKSIFKDQPYQVFKDNVSNLDGIFQFQKAVLQPILLDMLAKSTDGFTYTGIENIDSSRQYVFISNHRDITLDPSLITKALVENHFITPEVAIGDNLIQAPWIRDVLRLTKSFIVKRNLAPRELIESSKKLSQYIYHVITERNECVWIAQREGRAKDGNDVTQPGLITMLAMSAQGSLTEHFEKLNISPVTISYEYDPCDIEKARSLYANRYLGGYKKSHKEDVHSMRDGILGFKGRINIHFGEPIIDEIKQFPADEHRSEYIARIRHLLDDQIITGYKLWPTNFIASELYLKEKPDYQHYTKEQRQQFIQNIENKVSEMEGDHEKLRMIFYEMYARPVINKEKIMNEGSVHAAT